MKVKYIASLAVSAAVLAAGGIHLAFSQDKGTEACFVKSRPYSRGASACLAIETSPGIEHTCDAQNSWTARRSCVTPVAPSGQKYGPDDLEGKKCFAAGDFYSPGFEGCPNGKYQRCGTDGEWFDRGEIDGVKCK